MLLILFITPLAGCALSTKVESDFGTKTDSSDSSINSIQNPQYKIAVVADSNEDKFARCVERGLGSRLRKSIVISEEKFREEIYPHTQLCDRPSSEVQVHELLSNPIIHLKLLDIELDFIVYVGGSTNWKSRDGYMTPPAFPLPIWFGYTQKERKTSIRTTILDINKSRLAGNAFVRSKGIVAIPIAVLWVPIPLGLGTESSACNKTAQHIANSLIRRSFYSQNVEDAEEQSQLTSIDKVKRITIEDNPPDRAQLTRIYSTPTASGPVNRWFIDELRRLANEDNTEDQFTLGLMLHKGNRVEQDYQEALKWFKKASENGNVDAQYYLGSMYYDGRGVSQDYVEAEKWYREAAEQGYADVQYRLGYMHYEGLGVEQDYKEAFKWFKKAAEQGYAEGQYSLGYMYFQGEGVQKNYSEAIKWFKMAADQGLEAGAKALEFIPETAKNKL